MLGQDARPARGRADPLLGVVEVDPDPVARRRARACGVAASRSSLVQRRAVSVEVRAALHAQAGAAESVSVAHRTSVRLPFSCGRTYGVWSSSTEAREAPDARRAARVAGRPRPGRARTTRRGRAPRGARAARPAAAAERSIRPRASRRRARRSPSPVDRPRVGREQAGVRRRPSRRACGPRAPSGPGSTAITRWRTRCSPSARQAASSCSGPCVPRVVVGRRAPHVEPRPVEREVAERASARPWRRRSARARATIDARRRRPAAAAAAPRPRLRRRRQLELAPRDLVAGRRPRLVGGEHRPHRQPALAAAATAAPAARPRRSRPRPAGRRRARPPRPARPPPPASTRTSRCDRSRKSCRFAIRSRPASPVIRTGSITFLNSSSPGDGVRSGKSRPSATKLPSCSGSPKSPP